jgi:hypothetical protein
VYLRFLEETRANILVRDLFFYVAGYIVSILQINLAYNDSFDYYDSTYWILDQIQTRLFDVSFLFENLGNIFLLFCIVDLGLSFLYVWNCRPKGYNVIRGITAGLGVLLFALTVGYFAKIEALRTDFYNAASNSDSSTPTGFFSEPYSLIQLSVAFDIILWIASIAVAAFAIYVIIVSRQMTRLRNVS